MSAQMPALGELVEMLYSTEHPHVVDSRYTESVLGVHATSLDPVLQETLAALRAAEATIS
jgi:hypothetical protein